MKVRNMDEFTDSVAAGVHSYFGACFIFGFIRVFSLDLMKSARKEFRTIHFLDFFIFSPLTMFRLPISLLSPHPFHFILIESKKNRGMMKWRVKLSPSKLIVTQCVEQLVTHSEDETEIYNAISTTKNYNNDNRIRFTPSSIFGHLLYHSISTLQVMGEFVVRDICQILFRREFISWCCAICACVRVNDADDNNRSK